MYFSLVHGIELMEICDALACSHSIVYCEYNISMPFLLRDSFSHVVGANR